MCAISNRSNPGRVFALSIRIMSLLRSGLACLLLMSGACSSGQSDDGMDPDGGVGPDRCNVEISLLSAMDPYEAPATIELEATALGNGQLDGAQEFHWSVTGPGAAVVVEPGDSFAKRARFVAEAPGSYDIAVQGRVGALTCVGSERPLEVRAAGARRAPYRLRIVPALEQSAVSHEEVVELWGGAAHDLGVFDLRGGQVIDSRVVDHTGAGVAAYIRVTPRSGGAALETHSDLTGAFSLRLDSRTQHDVLIVPSADAGTPDPAPVTLFADHDFSTGPDPGLVLAEGVLFNGAVHDSAGQPVEGTGVALRTGDLPAAIATTASTGLFAARLAAPSGTPVQIIVTPPADRALPSLEIAMTAGLTVAGATVTVAYASGLDIRTVAPQIVARDGATPVPGARVTWISRAIPAAGVVTMAGVPPANVPGTVRVTAIADAAGMLPPRDLARAVYDVVIDPPPGSGEVTTSLAVDLTAGTPALLSTAAPARITGRIVDRAGVGIAGARIAATPRGAIASSLTATQLTTATNDGSFELTLSGDGDYDVTIAGSGVAYGSLRLALTAPPSGRISGISDIVMPPVLGYKGRVMLGLDGASDATLLLLCVTCAGLDPGQPIAEAVTDRFGYFILPAPDPGVAGDGGASSR